MTKHELRFSIYSGSRALVPAPAPVVQEEYDEPIPEANPWDHDEDLKAYLRDVDERVAISQAEYRAKRDADKAFWGLVGMGIAVTILTRG